MPKTAKLSNNKLAWRAEFLLDDITARIKVRIQTLSARHAKVTAARDAIWSQLEAGEAENDPRLIRLEAVMDLLEDAHTRHVDRQNIVFRTICALGDIRRPDWSVGLRMKPNKSASWA